MSRPGPTVVVGGGIIGLCVAFYLAEQGTEVEVVERHAIGSGASWGNAGWVCESHSMPIPAPGVMRYALRSLGHPDSALYLRPFPDPGFLTWLWHFWRATSRPRFEAGYRALADLNLRTFDLYDKLAAAGIDTSLQRVGMVHAFLSREEAELTRALQAQVAAGRYDLGGEIVDGECARELEPALAPAVQAAYFVPGEGVVEPDRLLAGLTKNLTDRGVRLHQRTSVESFRTEQGEIVAVETDAGPIDCAAVAVAAGTWTSELLRRCGIDLPVQAGKGYSFGVDLDPAPTHALYLGDSKIAVTPLAGTTRIAGTMEFSGNNRRMNWRRITATALASRSYLGRWFEDEDDLTRLIRDPWVGARPLLPDGLPVIDRIPGLANGYVATGHAMLGITLGPATGEALARMMLSGSRPGELEPFTIQRR